MSCKQGNVLRSAVSIQESDFARIARKASASPAAHARQAGNLAAAQFRLHSARAIQHEHVTECEACAE